MREYTLVISDTSPLFYLEQVHQIELLKHLYGEIVVPLAVVAELQAGARKGERIPILSDFPWILLRKTKVPEFLKEYDDLGNGELEAIAIGLETENSLLLLDDRFARKVATLNGLMVTGIVGVLLRAKTNGLIPALAPLLRELQKSNFRVSEHIVQDALRLAGETI